MRIYCSIAPSRIGGGSNTFARLFTRHARKTGRRIVSSPLEADAALVIAHRGDLHALHRAKALGVRIVHRLDEHFEPHEDAARQAKHAAIVALNALADVTVFQSRFVAGNVAPHLPPGPSVIIHNGTDFSRFHPASKPGRFIGHVSWGYGDKKRLDLLRQFIAAHPEERFLLVGRQGESGLDFRFPHVRLAGSAGPWRMARFYRRMKLLYFPSENDPCPNTVVEALASGVPVCFNPLGGSRELVEGPGNVPPCGEPLDQVDLLMARLPAYRARCMARQDLRFEHVAERYLALLEGREQP